MATSKGTESDEKPREVGNVRFAVHNVYIKDVSFESPNVPHIFSEDWKPKLDFDLDMKHLAISEGIYEVTMNVTLTVKTNVTSDKKEKSSQTAFLVEVNQAGIFSIEGLGASETEKALATAAQSILFPYVRETVSSLVTRGGFPQLVLPPMNFDAMYQNYLEEQKSTKSGSKSSSK